MKSLTLAIILCLIAPMAMATPATCRAWGAMEVPYLGDTNLDTIGGATKDKKGRKSILLNPEILATYPPMARDFWLAHSCGHLALNPAGHTEAEADCYAMRSLLKKKIRKTEQMQELTDALRALPADAWPGHRPDVARIDALAQCSAK